MLLPGGDNSKAGDVTRRLPAICAKVSVICTKVSVICRAPPPITRDLPAIYSTLAPITMTLTTMRRALAIHSATPANLRGMLSDSCAMLVGIYTMLVGMGAMRTTIRRVQERLSPAGHAVEEDRKDLLPNYRSDRGIPPNPMPGFRPLGRHLPPLPPPIAAPLTVGKSSSHSEPDVEPVLAGITVTVLPGASSRSLGASDEAAEWVTVSEAARTGVDVPVSITGTGLAWTGRARRVAGFDRFVVRGGIRVCRSSTGVAITVS